jgi:site-specific recombinase XerD
MEIDEALREYRWARQYSGESLRLSRVRLGAWARWLREQGVTELERVTPSHVRQYQEHVSTRPARYGRGTLQPETTLGHAKMLHAFLAWCETEELVTGLSRKVVNPRRVKKVLRTFGAGEMRDLLGAAAVGRDRAIVAILLETGIRATELCKLRVEDVYLGDDGAWLLIQGKGGKHRVVAIGGTARSLLSRYLSRHRPKAGNPATAFLTRSGRPLTPDTLRAVLRRLGNVTGIRGLSPHALRRTYAVEFLKQGNDIARLARTLGHESIATSMIYLTSYSSADVAKESGGVLDKMRGTR